MNRTSIRRAVVPGIAALALALSACGAGNDDDARDSGSRARRLSRHRSTAAAPAPRSPPRPPGAPASRPTTRRHHQLRPGRLRHRPREVHREAYAFAGSDSYLNDDEGELTRSQGALRRRGPDRGPGLRQPDRGRLQPRRASTRSTSPPKTIADIFDGKITTWDDPAIAEPTTDADLPDDDDHPGAPLRRLGHHRELHRLPRRGRRRRLDRRARRPVADQGRRGRRGHLRRVVAAVKGGEGTIGYADESQAGDLGVVSVKVGEEFVAPSAEGAAKVARGLAAGRGPRPRSTWPSRSTAPRPSPAPTRCCWRRT